MASYAPYPALHQAAFSFPAIDNHAHPLLNEEHRHAPGFHLESIISEAEGRALTEDAVHTVACMRATAQLAPIFELGSSEQTWAAVKARREQFSYEDLCTRLLTPCNIQCMLLDDGLGIPEMLIPWDAHASFCATVKRIVRVETEAEKLLLGTFTRLASAHTIQRKTDVGDPYLISAFDIWLRGVDLALTTFAKRPDVIGFKSVVCYRTGLSVSLYEDRENMLQKFHELWTNYCRDPSKKIRLQHKSLNDHLVRMTLALCETHKKPLQFHCGMGDRDITLTTASPKHLQPLIEAYPESDIILLHSSYPYTQEAGYLTAMYSNVFMDFGEIFPYVSGKGQKAVLRQILELCPTNKIMWSTDGHFFPETYYLGTIQVREAIYEVLSEHVAAKEFTEAQAVNIAENALFHNANRVYKLGLQPDIFHKAV